MTDQRAANSSDSLSRRRPNFSTRTAEEDVSRLDPSESTKASPEHSSKVFQGTTTVPNRENHRYEPLRPSSRSPERHRHSLPTNLFSNVTQWWSGQGRDGRHDFPREGTLPPPPASGPFRESGVDQKEREAQNRASDNPDKLGTFSGVFVPTTLNVLSILMFLRFGFILGQAGLLGMLGLLVISYTINLVTTMSLSAIATNGTVRGGGAYYLISRSLGPEFGGSIGIVFYLGYVLNTGMNAVGLVDCFKQNFGTESGTWANFLEEGFWWQYLWGTIILVLCTGICLAGSSIFSRASNGLLVILLVATFSIPLSAIFMKPFSIPRIGVEFTGFRLQTLLENLKPKLTKGAAGSQLPGRENFQDLFGILFPATGGIFAGASMSGDLKNPSKSIPKGTLCGLGLTFVTYTLVIVAMAASITRDSFYRNANVVQVANLSGAVILMGEFATSFFSSLMGVIGSAKLLQAIARDGLLPGLGIFGQGTKKADEPVYAIIITYIVAQVTMLFDINQIASFVTMTYLMTFLVTNLACFLLKIGSAPNFRPSFHYFNWQTAATGALVCGASMFFVDGVYASGCVAILMLLFLLIHYSSPPKPWGDVSQSLIYHQVRKYLLRLRQEHVKFWRPQILLFVTNLEEQSRMISFCNSLKKGGLFVLGHVLVTDDFSAAVPEARRQQSAWTKFVENSRVKAFVNITVSPTPEWGIRNVALSAGLGGMRPNIVIIDQFRKGRSLVEKFQFPGRRDSGRKDSGGRRISREAISVTDSSPETPMACRSYVTILEDLLFKLRMNVAVAKGFENLELPGPQGQHMKKYIDLWPIQMSAELGADTESKKNVLTTNFDTYTLILQLGCILNTVPSWKKTYKLRVSVFVEYETDVEDERGRVEALLEKLRIEAEVLVFWLACGDLKTYRMIVNGEVTPETEDYADHVHEALKDEDWWQDIRRARSVLEAHDQAELDRVAHSRERMSSWPVQSPESGIQRPPHQLVGGLRKLMQSSKRRRSISSFRGLGSVSLGMQTHRLLDAFVDYDVSSESSTSDSSDEEFEPYRDDNDSDEEDEHHQHDYSHGPDQSSQQNIFSSIKAKQRESSESVTPDQPVPSIIMTADTGTDPAGTPQTPPSPSTVLPRPKPSRSPSSNRFSSSPIPEARVNTEEEGAGPSIMFAASSSPPRSASHHRIESIYTRRSSSGPSSVFAARAAAASGYPQQASVPFSFNDLPSRAQHLILNELMVRHSEDTAVIFTTLPSPSEGTAQNETASASYLSDLEIFWQGLPPCLLVHSNSMTVTMNL
ncbi:putative cation chloride cotransporter [Aspergillus brunneoviolaceus CBS 621.78]|uniref:Cation chloride cotransporter n=1 Tax=Aspergillus brunneoviolaceus CBS 621.78 TaxID=1450534 RepID=A0ACD1GQ24_9EURO|nr:cation chloride cotransporter [Aspergillus brunneoviolaceus CBS 621.78]RAH51317.1 cation chloride cotransporter [Aspergillus brunneoviolaceus CBS 621.78]